MVHKVVTKPVPK